MLAALNSQAQTKQTTASQVKRSDSDPATMDTANGNTLFMTPTNGHLGSFEYTPDLDYLDGGDNFDFENADLGGVMIGALPGSGAGNDIENGEGHEKRKSPDDNNDEEGGDAKRQETKEGEKGVKKPGRKPLTNEPTTVSVPSKTDSPLDISTDSYNRSARPRTVPPNAPSASAKRRI